MLLSKFSLKDKVALVNGASRGIGRSIAIGLAEAGADVIVASRKLKELEELAGEIRHLGRRSLALASNTRNLDEIVKLVEKTMESFGRIDILINNAACNPFFGPTLEVEEPVWDAVMGLNLKGFFFLSQAVAKIMRKQGGGNIINTSSFGAFGGTWHEREGMGVYCVSKAAIIMVTKVMAAELAKFNIRVNCIAPGVVKTKMSEALWKDENLLQKMVKRIPLKRLAMPEEMVGPVVFLASDASGYITGETLIVDGGILT